MAYILHVNLFGPGVVDSHFEVQDIEFREWQEAAVRRKPASTSWQLWSQRGSNEENVWSKAPAWHLSGEKERSPGRECMSVCVCVFGKVKFQWRRREVRWQHERELYLFLERGEAADGLKGYLFVKRGEGVVKREDREQRAVRYCASWSTGNSWSCSWQDGEGAKRGAEWILAVMRTSAYERIGLFEWQYKKTGARREIRGMRGQLSNETCDW